MRKVWSLAMVSMLACAGLQAQSSARRNLTPDQYRMMLDDQEYWRQQDRRYRFIRKRALELAPSRRNTPLRDLNISDGEVREVEAISARYLPRSLVNISPVVTDCPCEEGPACTAQVYVLATAGGKTSGLQLSRMNNVWQVGMVQAWWLKRGSLQRQKTGNAFLDDYLWDKANNELLEEFPACIGQLVPARQTASTQKPEVKK